MDVNSLAIIVSVDRTSCAKKARLSRARLAGIIIGGAIVFVVIFIILGLLAMKKGFLRRIFNAKTDDGHYVA